MKWRILGLVGISADSQSINCRQSEVADEFGDSLSEGGRVYCHWTELALRLGESFEDETTLLSTFWRTCV